MKLLRDGHPDGPAAEMAFTDWLLRAVASGELPEVARVYRPEATIAFGRRDLSMPGYPVAKLAARAHGFVPIVRLVGGRAVAYHQGCVIVDVISPATQGAAGAEGRFAALAAVLEHALRAVGIEPQTGELPGEYCPGRWSLHAAGSGVKLAGLAQRSVRGAALTSALIAVEGSSRLRDALTSVYAALELSWDPDTAGAACDVHPALRVDDVEQAVVAALADRWALEVATMAEVRAAVEDVSQVA